jgi:hypothetical protein
MVQVVEPMAAWKRPALQLTQAWASIWRENWPGAQSAHLPVLDLYFPAVHDVVESVVLQSAWEVEPAWDDVPEGHILQDSFEVC